VKINTLANQGRQNRHASMRHRNIVLLARPGGVEPPASRLEVMRKMSNFKALLNFQATFTPTLHQRIFASEKLLDRFGRPPL
jgi:hypothetical protein